MISYDLQYKKASLHGASNTAQALGKTPHERSSTMELSIPRSDARSSVFLRVHRVACAIGCRASEASRMPWEHVDLDRRTVTIRRPSTAKGGHHAA